MHAITRAIVYLAAAAACGCGPAFHQPTPTGFVELRDQEAYAYRAVTADGLVLAVRELAHEPKGELEFWTEAIANHMRQRGGYALLETRDVNNGDGLAGKQLRFGHDESSKPHLYYITVFVTDDHLYLLEAGGTREQMERRDEQLAWAVESFRAK